jgi:tRNA1Val (adenine37-N6)-methyltransferase
MTAAFRFKQFSVDDSRCAMKVGTDGVLLGAWTRVSEAQTVLDIGTGCGLIALMVAQKGATRVVGIDIDEAATLQSKENFSGSPWEDRLEAIHAAVQLYDSGFKFDLIICNPPFFRNALKAPDLKRSLARHEEGLSFEGLLVAVDRLLVKAGRFAFILPCEEGRLFLTLAAAHGFYLNRCCEVYSREGKMPNRIMGEISRVETLILQEILTIRDQDNQYAEQYKELTGEFYLFLK